MNLIGSAYETDVDRNKGQIGRKKFNYKKRYLIIRLSVKYGMSFAEQRENLLIAMTG